MVGTCVDYALHQLTKIEAFEDELHCQLDYGLYLNVCFIWKKDCLGELELDYDPIERNSEIDEYWKEAYTQIQSCKRELMFLKMILWCFGTWDYDTDANLRSMLTNLEALWEDFGERIDDNILLKTEPGEQDWDVLASFLEGTIQQSKVLMVDYCYVLLHSSLKCNSLSSDQMFQFLQLVLHNLEVVVAHKADVIQQTDTLKLRLILSESFFVLMTAHEGVDCKELRGLMLCFQTFAYEAAPLLFLLWVNAERENLTFEAKLHQILSDMHQNIIKPCGNDVTALYFVALKAIKLQPSDDPFLYEQVVEGLINLHLDDLVAASKDDLRNVREGLICLLTFVSTPPQGCNQDEKLALICNQIDLLFSECTYLVLSPHLIMKDKMLLNDFAEKIIETMENLKKLYVKVPSYNFPRTNGLGFYHLLLQNLERLKAKLDSDTAFIPFAKNFIVKIEEELVSLRPLVNSIFKLQKAQMEFGETWSQLINLAYRIEHVVNSCSVRIHPIWYNMESLSVILDQIQDVKRNLEKVGVKKKLEQAGKWKIHYTSILPTSLQSTSAPLEITRFSLNNQEEVISLKEETSKIMDELTGGMNH